MIPGHETFARAPIEEAAIDLRVTRLAGAEEGVLDAFLDAVKTDYPQRARRVQFDGSIAFSATGEQKIESSQRNAGWLLRSTDGAYAVQPQAEGLTVSRLRPYTCWDDLRSKARRLWSLYAETTSPALVIRVGTRFINRIMIPEDSFQLTDWLRTGPLLGDGVPSLMSEFFMRVVVRQPSTPSLAVVCLHTQPADAAKRTPTIFDIDAFQQVSLGPGEEGIWAVLEDLRDLKNLVFFNSITDRTRGLFR